jgi:hypothetical protein
MRKQPLVLMMRSESGVQSVIGAMNCDIPNRTRLPIPPPIATKEYLLMEFMRDIKGKPFLLCIKCAWEGPARRRF